MPITSPQRHQFVAGAANEREKSKLCTAVHPLTTASGTLANAAVRPIPGVI